MRPRPGPHDSHWGNSVACASSPSVSPSLTANSIGNLPSQRQPPTAQHPGQRSWAAAASPLRALSGLERGVRPSPRALGPHRGRACCSGKRGRAGACCPPHTGLGPSPRASASQAVPAGLQRQPWDQDRAAWGHPGSPSGAFSVVTISHQDRTYMSSLNSNNEWTPCDHPQSKTLATGSLCLSPRRASFVCFIS